MVDERKHKGWFSRGYLPHFDCPGLVQSITFRLADSLPRKAIQEWRSEFAALQSKEAEIEIRRRIELSLDKGIGSCYLRVPEVAEITENALLHFDGTRYRLIAWCIMPNHVHVLVEMIEGFPLPDVIHSWKLFSAREANNALGRSGEFWMREYYDRYVRDVEHFEAVRRYIEDNPVKAGLVNSKELWRWSSAWHRRYPGSAGL